MTRRLGLVTAAVVGLLLGSLAHPQAQTALKRGWTTISAYVLAPTGCTTVPYSFTGNTNTGICQTATNRVGISAANVPRVEIGNGRIAITGDTCLGWVSSTTDPTGTVDARSCRTATKTGTFDDGAGGAATHIVIGSQQATVSTKISTVVAVASLPAAPVEGMLAAVSDANSTTFNATCTGGGANHVACYYNGSAWVVH